jgi:hypothetical protein
MKQAEFYEKMGREIEDVQAKGIRNTDIYLSWDYMDVYVATSMRKRWEFEETADFISQIFDHKRIRALKVRYFDPTMSQCSSRIDKGLVEGLMLKRARCTLYMVQESDTMGKDSELASTLAQGKPVIAYVPTIKDISEYAKKIARYPLEFFKIRFQILQAEGLLENDKVAAALLNENQNFITIINDFLSALSSYRAKQPFSLWDEKEQEFKKGQISFTTICRLLSIAEQANFNKRADILKKTHPLSLQVHLESGVANGLLVVRTIEQCTELLYQLLTNSLAFIIEHDKVQNCTLLKETLSDSPFRVVSDHEKLANSFWNFYLATDSN